MSARSAPIGIIGGSGFTELYRFEVHDREEASTPYGEPSSDLIRGKVESQEVVFIARHGTDHSIAPHQINYRANLWALKQVGVEAVMATVTVGGIDRRCHPGSILIPDQVLDYTHSREHTFSPMDGELLHVDFTQPYCEALRGVMIQTAHELGVDVLPRATYAATQGPRFESSAEIERLNRDGAHIVGMTGMPETSLAREIGLCYATVALVVNYAAGRFDSKINVDEIKRAYKRSSGRVWEVLAATAPKLTDFDCRVPPVIKV